MGSAPAKILEDIGAAASFVSKRFARTRGLSMRSRDSHTVELPNGDKQHTAAAVLPHVALTIRITTGTYQFIYIL